MNTGPHLSSLERTLSIGQNIRLFREQKRVTLSDMALGIGITTDRLKRIEGGKLKPSASELLNVSRILERPVSDFFGGEGHLPPGVRPIDLWFSQSILPHARAYFGIAYSLTKHREAAHDLVQDAYARVLAYEAWDTIEQPRAFVIRIILNLARSELRHQKVISFQGLPDNETLEFASGAPDGFETVSVRQQLARALDALKKLPATTRYVLSLRRLEGVPIKEIASRLGISVKGVDYHIARGSYLLAKAIEDDALAKGVPDQDDAPPR